MYLLRNSATNSRKIKRELEKDMIHSVAAGRVYGARSV